VDQVLDEDPAAIWTAEFYAGIGMRLRAPYLESRELLDPALAQALDVAYSQTLEGYLHAQLKRYELRDKLRRFFDDYDLLLTPQVPVAAFDVGIDIPAGFPGRNFCSWQFYTYPFNLTGQPAASVPAGFTAAGLPVGLQMVAAINKETDIFRAAAAFEAHRPWAHLRPAAIR
jgi:Asp-tRNA(Asn)/Glu-tRNA(Gln) amidotransferase A subunit family amidase